MIPSFTVEARDGAARAGRLATTHGVIETPAFMPVGTYGTVKAMTPEELEQLGAEIILGNTFHLLLRPGAQVISAHGGLHGFMHWQRPILTDSGGFQVFSLKSLRRITEEGVRFRSPVDGSEVRLTPEDSMDMQLALRSDIAMALDDCTAHPATEAAARLSMERSMRWAERSHRHYYRAGEPPGGLFGIVQGGMHGALRLASLESLLRLEWPGLAVGGLAVGESEEERLGILESLVPHMPPERPRYLMGVGGRRTSWRRCCAASTCSTASCRRAMPATATCSRPAGSSTSATACIRRTSGRSILNASAIPAATTAAPTCATWTAATRSSARA